MKPNSLRPRARIPERRVTTEYRLGVAPGVLDPTVTDQPRAKSGSSGREPDPALDRGAAPSVGILAEP